MPVSILNAWVSEADYPTNGLSLAASAGDNRAGVLILTGEIENDAGGGVGVTSVTWGGQTCVEQEDVGCGDVTSFNDSVAIYTLNEAGVAAMSGSAITITWTNFNGDGTFGTGGIGPFGNGKVAAAFYEDVDQANLNSASNTGTTGATSGTADNLNMGEIDTDADEQVIVGGVSGQGSTDDDWDAETGYTIELQLVGATNDHTLVVFTRDAQTNDDALNTNFNVGSVNRLSLASISLGFAQGLDVSTTEDTLIITEQASTVNREREAETATDTLVLGEQGATVTRIRNVACNTAALAITTQPAAILTSIDVVTTEDTLIVTGQPGGIVRQHNIDTNTGVLQISEESATVNRARGAQSSPDAKFILENPATVNGQRGVNAFQDTIVVAGRQATIKLDKTLDPNFDTLAIAEQSATINRARGVSSIDDGLAIAEQSSTIATHRSIATQLDTLVVAALGATVTKTIVPGFLTVDLIIFEAGLKSTNSIVPGLGV